MFLLRKHHGPSTVRADFHSQRLQRGEWVLEVMLVDERVGSKDLLGPLCRYGVPAELTHLDFGDFAFIGKGLEGADVFIGIELKETRDLVSSMYSQRFAGHQAIGLQSTYNQIWLLTEGIWRADDSGVMEHMAKGWRQVMVGTRRVMLNDLESWILSQVTAFGFKYWHSPTRVDTIRFLSVLYRWWTAKELQEHRSHQAIYLPPPDRVMMSEPSEMLRMLSGIDGVGWDKGRAIEDHFGTWGRLHNASMKELMKVPGVGKVIATHIREVLS